jgi:hypothetical protein
MALCQILCPQIQALRSSPGLRIITQKVGDLHLIGDSSTGTFRPLVPRDIRRQVFEHLHGATHPGRRATCRLVSSRYVSKGLSKDIIAWAKACLDCQRAKVYRHIQVPLQHILVPTRRFSHIHVDLVGPLPATKGYTYLFTVMDRTSRWPEAIPIAAISTVNCANALFQVWVSRFGVPTVITSDRRPSSPPPCAPCSTSSTARRQPTTHSLTGWWNVSTTASRTPSSPYTVLRRSLHHFTLRINNKEDKVSTLWLKPCTNPTGPPAQPRVRGRPPGAIRFQDFPPPGATASTFRNTTTSRTMPGTVFPWPAARGFGAPRHRSRPRRCSARPQLLSAVQIRPLGLRP